MILHQGEDDVLQSHRITGVITEFHKKSSGKSSAKPHKSVGQIAIAVVKLNADTIAENGYARVMVPRDKFAVGNELPLVLKLYKNGSRKIFLAPEPDTQTPTQTGD